MSDTFVPYGRRTQRTLALAEIDFLWLTAGRRAVHALRSFTRASMNKEPTWRHA